MKLPAALTILLLLILLLTQCTKTEKAPYTLPEKALQLLTADSSKVWKLARRFNNQTRMNMGDCFLSHRDTYFADLTMNNNSGEFSDCGETLQAQWKFTQDQYGNYYIKWTSDQLPDLLNIESDSKLFKILTLTDEQLTLQYNHRQFSNKTTTITDIFVPEAMNIEGRAFHW